MAWTFFDFFFSFYLIFALCTVLLYIKSPLQLDQKSTYFYFFMLMVLTALCAVGFEAGSLVTAQKLLGFSSQFYAIFIFIFFVLVLGALVFSQQILIKQRSREEFYILLYFFLMGSYFLFKVNDFGILYLIIELPRIGGLCFSS
jgi:NADH:ubiquinone oxidoreductase subunit 2 (subunit N)